MTFMPMMRVCKLLTSTVNEFILDFTALVCSIVILTYLFDTTKTCNTLAYFLYKNFKLLCCVFFPTAGVQWLQ